MEEEEAQQLSIHSDPKEPSITSRQASIQPTEEPPPAIAEEPQLPTEYFKVPTPLSSFSKQASGERSPLKTSRGGSIKSTDKPPENMSIKSANAALMPDLVEENLTEAVSKLVPQGESISDHVDQLTESVKKLATDMEDPQSPAAGSNLEKIARMSKVLTNEANALRQSIRSLTSDIERTKQNMNAKKEDVNFPYHLFLIEMIVNKIHMKCDCFDLNSNNLVISATFLGKQPIILYDASYGKIENFSKLNVGKSTLFAMTYDKICLIQNFEILLQITKEPPCSSCVTKVAESHMDYTKDFLNLRQELCTKWKEEKPNDNIICTTSTPLSKSMFYLSCGENCIESIGIVEMSVRMSFLGKEINTAFCASSNKHKTTSLLTKEDNGMTMYNSQKVEMDAQGKIILDEDDYMKKQAPSPPYRAKRSESPASSRYSGSKGYAPSYQTQYQANNGVTKYDEIFTKVNTNELKIRVPKPSLVERNSKYEKIQELCTCEELPYNTGEQIQLEMPRELCYPDKTHNTYSSNLKYTFKGCDKTCESKERKVVNVTPTNCPISAVNMEKEIHPQKDVFILKIGKKMETKDKKTDLEIELCTPKIPLPDKLAGNNMSQQCSTSDMRKKKKKGKKDKGKKLGKGGKGSKSGKGKKHK